jgi:hypothetical protein
MNERLKELARQAKPSPNLIWKDAELERFADLVRQDLIAMYKQALTDPENQPSQYGTVTVEYMEQQIALDREVCAELCEEASLYFEDDRASASYAADYCANEIRKRGEK